MPHMYKRSTMLRSWSRLCPRTYNVPFMPRCAPFAQRQGACKRLDLSAVRLAKVLEREQFSLEHMPRTACSPTHTATHSNLPCPDAHIWNKGRGLANDSISVLSSWQRFLSADNSRWNICHACLPTTTAHAHNNNAPQSSMPNNAPFAQRHGAWRTTESQ